MPSRRSRHRGSAGPDCPLRPSGNDSRPSHRPRMTNPRRCCASTRGGGRSGRAPPPTLTSRGGREAGVRSDGGPAGPCLRRRSPVGAAPMTMRQPVHGYVVVSLDDVVVEEFLQGRPRRDRACRRGRWSSPCAPSNCTGRCPSISS
jgi:hypothetical protein